MVKRKTAKSKPVRKSKAKPIFTAKELKHILKSANDCLREHAVTILSDHVDEHLSLDTIIDAIVPDLPWYLPYTHNDNLVDRVEEHEDVVRHHLAVNYTSWLT